VFAQDWLTVLASTYLTEADWLGFTMWSNF